MSPNDPVSTSAPSPTPQQPQAPKPVPALLRTPRRGDPVAEAEAEAEINDYDDPTQKVNGTFMGLTFAVSGTFIKITRQKIEQFIDKHKGKLMPTVSRKTHFLILGHILEDGRKPQEGQKYKKAKAFGETTIYSEEEFEQFCRRRLRNPEFLLGGAREKYLGVEVEEDEEEASKAEKEIENLADVAELLERG